MIWKLLGLYWETDWSYKEWNQVS